MAFLVKREHDDEICLGGIFMYELRDRQDLLEDKKYELDLIITHAFDSVYIGGDNIDSKKLINDFYSSGFINITAPQEEPPKLCMMVLDSLSDYRKGESIKPGNILLNFKKMIDSLPEITTAVVSVFYDIPILKLCAALTVYKSLKNVMTIEITKSQAIVIYALWKNCNKENKIKLEDGFNNANQLISNLEENEMTWNCYIEIVEQLEKLHCIKVNDNGIWLCEWIRKQYR